MSETTSSNLVSLFHSLGDETVKQGAYNRNTLGNSCETSTLKALAHKVLQRNRACNKGETNPLNGVSLPYLPEIKQTEKFILPSGIEDYEERVAIAEYDGGQSSRQAHRIAYQDTLITILNANPPDDSLKSNDDWFMERIKSAKDLLITKGLTQPR